MRIALLIILLILVGSAQVSPLVAGCPCMVNYPTRNYKTQIPFGYANRLLIVNVQINQNCDKHHFVLDSGAPTFITDTIVQRYNLLPDATAMAFDANNNVSSIKLYGIRSIQIGQSSFKHISAAGGDQVNTIPALAGRADGGLIGADIMKQSIWSIDYVRQLITITDNVDSLLLPQGSISIPLHIDYQGIPVVDIETGGRTIRAIIDLGYNGSILLPESILNKKEICLSEVLYERSSIGSGFETTIKNVEYHFLRELKIGALRATGVKASTTGHNTVTLIGNEFLEKYYVTFDFLHHRLWLSPKIPDLIKVFHLG